MLDERTIVVYLIAGAAIVSSAWITFVPESVSGSTFGSILAVAFGLLVVSTIALRSSRATPSVAQVLYETEHPSALSAQRSLRGMRLDRRAMTRRRRFRASRWHVLKA
jgi:hypothetical protein